MSDSLPFYYYGRAENKLNSKGQVAIPARIRATLPENEQSSQFVIIRGSANCLYMYTHRQFAVVKDNARRYAEEKHDSDFFRKFMAEAHAVDLDTQGRFVLPQNLMKAVGIAGPGVVFLGVDQRIELWDPSHFRDEPEANEKYEETRREAAGEIFGI